jgi:hypothetical protein
MKRRLTIWISLVTLLLALGVPLLHTALAKPVPASHPEYHEAMESLRSARKHLEKADADGYGHREQAMRAIDHALDECNQAVQALH